MSMRRIKDTKLLLLSLWLIIFGLIHFTVQACLYIRNNELIDFSYNTSTFFTRLFRTSEILGYAAISVVVFYLVVKAIRGTERVGTLFLAIWLGMTGVLLSMYSNFRLGILNTTLGIVAGVLLMIEFRGQNVTENIGRYLLAFWMILTPLVEFLAILLCNEFPGLFGHILEMRAALGIMALVSGIFLLISRVLSPESEIAMLPKS